MRVATNGVLAFRARGFKSSGDFPGYLYFGGNSEMRGYDYLEFLGNKAFFLNAELRFPLIEAALTPLGVIGGVRGVVYAGMGAAGYEGVPMNVWTHDDITVTPLLGFQPNYETFTYDPVYGPPKTINGFKLVDGRASYGLGLETFALGVPIVVSASTTASFSSRSPRSSNGPMPSGAPGSFRRPESRSSMPRISTAPSRLPASLSRARAFPCCSTGGCASATTAAGTASRTSSSITCRLRCTRPSNITWPRVRVASRN